MGSEMCIRDRFNNERSYLRTISLHRAMTSGKTSAIARRGYLNIRTSKYILTGLSAVLLSLLYFNFLLTPELSRQTQLLAQIEQIKSGLHKVKAVNIKSNL